MNELDEELTQAFIRMLKHASRASLLIEGTITSVDLTAFTCTVTISANENGGDINTEFYDVPLKIIKNSQASVIEIPTIGTNCLMCFRDNNIQRGSLFSVHSCDKLLINIGSTSAEFNTGKDDQGNVIAGIVFNGGQNNGLVLLQGILTAINRLEDKLKNHQHSYIPFPGGAPGNPVLTTSGQPLDETLIFNDTQQSDIENVNIKQ